MKFYNRDAELTALRKWEKAKGSHFLVISGRRRVGKTELIRQFGRECELIYFFVDKRKSSALLGSFRKELLRRFPDEVIGELDWNGMIELIFRLGQKQRLVAVFDEFQNFAHVDPSVFSLFQKHWDEYSGKSEVFLIAMGSYVGLMKKLFNSQESALFGRKTGEMLMKPLDFAVVLQMLRDMGVNDFSRAVEIYALFGGLPNYYVYLEKYAKKLEVPAILKELLFSEPRVLRGEAARALYEQMGGERDSYLSILSAISNKKHSLAEIAAASNVGISSAPKYLSELADVYELIIRRIPVTEDRRSSKKGRYFLKDAFLRFWFRFIEPNRSLYEMERHGELLKIIMGSWAAYVGRVFEDICLDFLKESTSYTDYGPWWSRRGDEIDIIALNEKEKEILFAECKWKDKVDAEKVLNGLKEKAKLVQWNKEERKESYAIFAKSFKKKTGGAMCFDLKDIERALKR
jgi:uncharacterized protein